MQFVTFGIDKGMNLVIQFQVFIQPYTQKPLILYQVEIVPVLILDENIEAQSYTHLKVKKPYLTLNSETYISLTHQELRSCKKIGNEFYCEELFDFLHNYINTNNNDEEIFCLQQRHALHTHIHLYHIKISSLIKL